MLVKEEKKGGKERRKGKKERRKREEEENKKIGLKKNKAIYTTASVEYLGQGQ